MISYEKLFELMKKQGKTTTQIREQKIIAQINSEIESGKNLRLYRFCIVSLLFGWTVLQNLYAGRFFAAAII